MFNALSVESDQVLSSSWKCELLLDVERYRQTGVRLPRCDVVVETLVVVDVTWYDELESIG